MYMYLYTYAHASGCLMGFTPKVDGLALLFELTQVPLLLGDVLLPAFVSVGSALRAKGMHHTPWEVTRIDETRPIERALGPTPLGLFFFLHRARAWR